MDYHFTKMMLVKKNLKTGENDVNFFKSKNYPYIISSMLMGVQIFLKLKNKSKC